MLERLLRGPAAYAPNSGWPAWSVLPVGAGIFALALAIAAGASYVAGTLAGGYVVAPEGDVATSPQVAMQLAVFVIGLQGGIIALTLLAGGLTAEQRADVLALKAPAQGWGVVPVALIPLFVITGLWTAALLLLNPTAVYQDLRPYQDLMRGDVLWIMLPVICLGAPLSEELLFRGFIFSGLAKSPLGLSGTAILTTLLWTALHAGYSAFGLGEVLAIGLYFSWLLIRTGSLWVTIACHSLYNSVIAAGLLLVKLPPPG
jgi:membrane protease YdiL (CAAX protease family)